MKRFVFLFAALALSLGCHHTPPHTDSGAIERGIASDENDVNRMDVDAPWAYDPGPMPGDRGMGDELIELVSNQPYMPGISQEVTGDQKFRPAFGPTLWRMLQKPNSVKILFIGQDGTHIAEAAGRTATAGFGGRAQDLAAYFGVNTGAAFINTFAFTIRGQYAAFQTPFIMDDGGGKKVALGSIIDNGIWMMAQDQNSPMVQWRNGLIDWIIRNNKNSLKMIVLFGGSARDSIGTFIESRGGKVGSRYSEQDLLAKNIKVPMFNLESAGSNKEFAAILDQNGKDIYPKVAGRRLNYSKEEDTKAAIDALSKNINSVYGELAITNTGVGRSGLMHPAQIGGYDLNKIEIGGKRTLSLKGLTLSDGSKISSDVLIADFPHPTALSMMPRPEASKKIASSLKDLDPYVRAGWRIEADSGMRNEFSAGRPYVYGRTDIGPAYYDFGTPKNRMVSVSSASRMTGRPNIIVIGTREKAKFDSRALEAATKAKKPDGVDDGEMFTARPRLKNTRAVFDRGPGLTMARIMKENLDLKAIAKTKAVKTDLDDVGDFGHYRGTFNRPRVVILADPDGVDDILTSRALTGTRGQYLHGLMEDIGVGDKYVVIKTVPFGMDGASDSEWRAVLGATARYRQEIFKAIFAQGKPEAIIADGKYAASEISSLLGSEKVPLITIQRSGSDNGSGIREAGAEVSKNFRGARVTGRMANIPRTHLGFFARVWEGTSGTRVFASTTPADSGTAFAIVAPAWSYQQKVKQPPQERTGVENIKTQMFKNGLPRPGESFLQFRRRIDTGRDSRYVPPQIQEKLPLAA